MLTFITFALVLGLCFLGLGVKIFFSKEGKFPETEVGHNREMRRRGITCPRQDEMAQRKKAHLSCEGCGLAGECEAAGSK